MTKNIDIAWDIAKRVTEVAINCEIKVEPREFTSSIAPIISNQIYKREKELLEEERFRTIIRLSMYHGEDVVLGLIKNLEYEINTKNREL